MATVDPTWIAAAQASQAACGWPASITIAQFCAESAWGTKIIPGSNNPFNIKAVPGQPFVMSTTHEFVNGQEVAEDDAFAAYPTLADGFTAYGRLVTTSAFYAHVRVHLPDIEATCMALGGGTPQLPSFSTNPDYGTTLMQIINFHNLTQYDKVTGE